MTSSYLLHIVAFVWPWQHITHSISPIITTIFGRGCIAANFPVGAASLRSNGETFNGEAQAPLVAPENIFPILIFPDVEQSIAEQSKSVKVGQNTPSSNPVSDDPPLISWSLDLIQVYK